MAVMDDTTEAQVLAAMLNDKECLDTGIAILHSDHFSHFLYRMVYSRMTAMYSAGQHVDAITVYDAVRDVVKGQGTAWMLIKDAAWGKGTFDYWVSKLLDLAQKRKLAHFIRQLEAMILKDDPAAEILREAENQLYGITANTSDVQIVTPKDHAVKMLETLAARIDKKSNGGIRTSYAKLNFVLNGGFLPGQMIIFAAQTGKGKTAFALNLMRDIAVTQRRQALYVNTEMGDEQISCRWMSILTDHPDLTHTKIASGLVNEHEQRAIMQSMERMHLSGFHSVTIPDLTVNTLVSTARRFKAQKDMKVLVVDYVGRMDTSDPKMQEWQVYKFIAKRLKTLAQELQITVIMLAQITEGEKLEGSRAMKNECDLFGYLREAEQEELNTYGKRFNYTLAIEKNRDGQRGKIPLQFIGEKMTFVGESADEIARNKQELAGRKQEPGQDNRHAGNKADTGGGRTNRAAGQRRLPYDD